MNRFTLRPFPPSTAAVRPRRRAALLALAGLACSALGATQAQAATQAPDALIEQLSQQVLAAVKFDKAIQDGDLGKLRELVDTMVMPHVDLPRMTASVVGRSWRQATTAQRQALEHEFKALLIRTYGGALTQVRDQTIRMRPFRGEADAKAVVVRTQVHGSGRPIQLDYRLVSTAAGWKIYDLNVLGVWLLPVYRDSFGRAIETGGIDGLISDLSVKNKSLAAP